LHDNGFLYAVNTQLLTGQPMAALRQLWEVKEDHSTFEQRATDMTLVIETLRPLGCLIPQPEH
jgi:hypothetical protein